MPAAERPRLSSLLVLLLSGALCFAASYCSRWLPDAVGRFAAARHRDHQGDKAPSEDPSSHMPDRPHRHSLPVLVVCVALRLEVFYRVNDQQQCASPGIEVTGPRDVVVGRIPLTSSLVVPLSAFDCIQCILKQKTLGPSADGKLQ